MQKFGFYVGMNEVANATNKVDRNTHTKPNAFRTIHPMEVHSIKSENHSSHCSSANIALSQKHTAVNPNKGKHIAIESQILS